jgi:hypothetical protein
MRSDATPARAHTWILRQRRSVFLLRDALAAKGIALLDINICTYITLNNEITIKDIAEGLERAFRNHSVLKNDPEFKFDAIVHSTGLLVIRSRLTNYGMKASVNKRLQRLKHLIGVSYSREFNWRSEFERWRRRRPRSSSERDRHRVTCRRRRRLCEDFEERQGL